MRLPHRQKGLGWFGLLLLFGAIAFIAIVAVKCLPLYLNQMKVAKAVSGVASDPELAASDATVIRDRLQRRWDIEDIVLLTPKDIKIRRTEAGRFLEYDYEARTRLFYNIDVVIHFKDEVPMRGDPHSD